MDLAQQLQARGVVGRLSKPRSRPIVAPASWIQEGQNSARWFACIRRQQPKASAMAQQRNEGDV